MNDGKHIGLHVTITDSKNKINIGKTGEIINETKKTITLATEYGQKIIFKDQTRLAEKK